MSKERYSYWREGFRVGDYIEFRVIGCFGYESREYRGLVLSREYLFTKRTKWGERKFFMYELYDKARGEKKKLYHTRDIKIVRHIGIV